MNIFGGFTRSLLVSCVLLGISCGLLDHVLWASEFESFLARVQQRDPLTNAIVRVRASDETRNKHNITDFWNFEIKVDGERAAVKVFRNYKTGPIGESYSFKMDEAVRRELKRYQNRQQLLVYDAAIEQAKRQRRIFVLSDFRLKAGATRAEIEQVFGKPDQVHYPTKAGSFDLDYAGVSVFVEDNRLWDIQPAGK